MWRWVPVAAALLAASCTCTGAPPPPAEVSIFITSALQGSLEPCGCAANMRGGIERTAGLLDAARSGGKEVLLIDVGSALFASAELPEVAVPQAEAKASTLARSLVTMGVAARVPGPLDDARGEAFRDGLGLPEVAPGSRRLLEVKGHRVGLVAASTVAEAGALARKARGAGAALVIAAVPDLPATGAEGVDLFVSTAGGEEDVRKALTVDERGQPGAFAVAAQSRGRTVVRVDAWLRGRGPVAWIAGEPGKEAELLTLDRRIELLKAQIDEPGAAPGLTALRQDKLTEVVERRRALAATPVTVPATGNVATVQLVPVESTLPASPAVAALLKDYNLAVGKLNVAWAQKHGTDCAPPDATTPGFVGSVMCWSCHPGAMEVWRATRHPKAYEALEAVGKQYHLDCIACHVTGWQQPGGVCRVDRPDLRTEVGCESCHGPGSTHMDNPVAANMPRIEDASGCVKCHDAENSPHFDFALYREKIRGPGHGLPNPDGGRATVTGFPDGGATP